MPELPEVETVARQLAPLLAGRVVRSFAILDARLLRGPAPPAAGRRIEGVSRAGKRVLVELSASTGDPRALWLAVHLRMTGRLIVAADGERVAREHLRARIRLDRGSLLFYDTRRFGTFDWYRAAEEAESGAVDPLSPALSPAALDELLGTSRQPLKAWLLRQDRLVGIGNIYASEILHAAGLSPHRAAATLDGRERSALLRSTRGILRRAIRNSGTTFSDFQDTRGLSGSYQRFLRVYDREGEPCRRCGGPILREVQQQRSTFWCSRCQR